jgi:hypothetical protein
MRLRHGLVTFVVALSAFVAMSEVATATGPGLPVVHAPSKPSKPKPNRPSRQRRLRR